IISLGNSLDLTIVAEGIETKEQLSYLNSLDCQLGQGFLISRPLVAEEVEMFLK
ncbi:MAG: EAL domain-containing protein, partial [Tissierellia bacterium]|nr:EAL domain-containing protein [Tissierellia bacterium]